MEALDMLRDAEVMKLWALTGGHNTGYNRAATRVVVPCRGGEIGRHAGLRNQCYGVRVRVSPSASDDRSARA